MLKCDLVHAHGVELVVELGLRLTSTESIGKCASEVTNLAHVNRDVRVVGAGSDGKWMPLVVADIRAVQEKPLSGLVLHAGLGELNLNGIYSALVQSFENNIDDLLTVWVANNLDDLGLASATNLTVEAIEEVKTTSHKLPSPSLVTNAVGPEVVVVEWRESWSGITDEAAGRMGVHAEQERDKQMMRVPEGLERLLANPVVRRGVD